MAKLNAKISGSKGREANYHRGCKFVQSMVHGPVFEVSRIPTAHLKYTGNCTYEGPNDIGTVKPELMVTRVKTSPLYCSQTQKSQSQTSIIEVDV